MLETCYNCDIIDSINRSVWWTMFSATLFGHRDFNYLPYREKIQAIIIDLIENHGVREFLSGFRGNFDTLCAEVIFDLKIHYPSIKNIMVLSYHNPQDFVLPKYFDESLYLLESRVPPRYAISTPTKR